MRIVLELLRNSHNAALPGSQPAQTQTEAESHKRASTVVFPPGFDQNWNRQRLY